MRNILTIITLSLLLMQVSCMRSRLRIVDATTEEEAADTTARPESVTIAMVGDIMMGTTFPKAVLPERDGATLFKDCREILRGSDMAVGNLEGTLTDGGRTRKRAGKVSFAFRSPTRYAQWLADAGFDFLATANNHANDFGEDGVEHTKAALSGAGIAAAGWSNGPEYRIVQKGGMRYGLTAFSRGVNSLSYFDTDRMSRIIRELREKCDILIVSAHIGAEGARRTHLPQGAETFLGENRGDVRAITERLIDLGADLVYCHGPHVPRCVSLYKGKFIAYSLGNFCTVSMSRRGAYGTAPLIQVTLDSRGDFREGQIYSFRQYSNNGPRADKTNYAAELIRQLTDYDLPGSPLAITSEGKITLR